MIKGLLRVDGETYTIIRSTGLHYAPLAAEWESISDTHKTFKDGNRVYFCEKLEDAVIIEPKE